MLLIKQIYSLEVGEVIIPDTSYLLNNPNFRTWTPKSKGPLNIIITTTVLGELDQHKEFHKGKSINETAKKIVKELLNLLKKNPGKNIKTIIRDKVYIVLDHIEPNSKKIFKELDFTIPDDRFIASALNIIRRYSKSDCYIATNDINQTNKAINFGIPVL